VAVIHSLRSGDFKDPVSKVCRQYRSSAKAHLESLKLRCNAMK